MSQRKGRASGRPTSTGGNMHAVVGIFTFLIVAGFLAWVWFAILRKF